MINLSEHIEHLIVRNDCVIVPGLGAFIAEEIPAYIDKECGRFMPPSRRLSFNPRIDHNDGMLVTSLIRRHRWSFALASETLADCVSALKSRLAAAGNISVGSLGTLRHQADATPEFIPSATSVSVNPYMVLPVLEIKPIKQLITESRQAAGGYDALAAYNDDMKRHTLWGSAARSVYGRVAVAVAVIAVCAFTLLSPMRSDRPTLASLGTGFSSTQPEPLTHELYISYPDPVTATATVKPSVPEQREDAPKLATAYVKPASARESRAAAQAPQPTKVYTTSSKPSVPQAAEAKTSYILVVASLTSDKEAHAFISQSGDSTLKVKKMGSRYRVYSDASESKDALVARRPAVASRYQGAWVCEVK